jgi:hypothetical protein
MTYRRQLFLTLLALVFVSTALFGAASYRICDRLLRREVHRKVHSIAATAALFLNPALVEQISSKGDDAKPQYAELKKTLQGVRDANRRKDVNVDYIFTLLPSHQNPSAVVYGVDTGMDSGLMHHPGDAFSPGGVNTAEGLDEIHRLDDQLDDFLIGEIKVKGRIQPVRIHRVLGALRTVNSA